MGFDGTCSHLSECFLCCRAQTWVQCTEWQVKGNDYMDCSLLWLMLSAFVAGIMPISTEGLLVLFIYTSSHFTPTHPPPSPLPRLREKNEVFKKQMTSLSASSCPLLVESECRTPGEFSRLLHLLFGVLLDIFGFFSPPKARKGSY